MKTRMFSLLAAGLLTFALTGCATSKSVVWDYKVAVVNGNMFGTNNTPVAEQTINSMTQQGWRLVSVSSGGPDPKIVIVFKRPK